MTSLLPYTPMTQEDLLRAMNDITPDFANDTIAKLIGEAYENSDSLILVLLCSTTTTIKRAQTKTKG
jgi:membrane protein